MKTLPFILLPIIGFTQTFQHETAYMNSKMHSGEMAQWEVKEMRASWQNLLQQFAGFPELPFNEETQRIEFIKIDNLKDLKKEQIYNRVKEWVAIN